MNILNTTLYSLKLLIREFVFLFYIANQFITPPIIDWRLCQDWHLCAVTNILPDVVSLVVSPLSILLCISITSDLFCLPHFLLLMLALVTVMSCLTNY